ncbi:phosphate acetyltransferase [Aestuariirhabdus litorea]|uniref:Phosphate acetyltransferase n=1 Tax=Aestuariirhabdus litorea TaxID=2528527 RepID=A0A3P3VTS9_9GAMM|nr:phosphate acetyltransferase [Aestuariirhabdus litorea]RRJ85378.1 phosphate acetyltransferase [Aestuariirhabdus litorea]RWW98602.1 phosphate acetyltransferase [Endozoicomonadaceae bacterium GTF-13]
MHTFFIAPTSFGVGLTSVSLGLVRALDNVGLRVAFCKPIAQQHATDSGPERSTLLIHQVMGLTPSDPITLERVEDLLGDHKRDILMEQIVGLFQKSADDADVVIVEGLVPTRQAPYVTRLNADIAKTLGAEVILVSASNEDSLDMVADKLEIVSDSFGGVSKKRVLGYIINKMSQEAFSQHSPGAPHEIVKLDAFRNKPLMPIGYIPWDDSLASPRTKDVAQLLNARVLNEGDIAQRRVTSRVLCARTAANITHLLKPGALIITPGDRDDIILAASLASLNGVPLAGLLLTNGIMPADSIMDLCRKAVQSSGLPVMLIETNSYNTATKLDRMNNEVPVDDVDRIERVMDSVASCINAEWLKERCGHNTEPRLSPPAFRYQLVQKAHNAHKRIVLPEGNEPRTIQAAAICHQRGIAQCILLGKPQEIQTVAEGCGLILPDDLVIMDPDVVRGRYIEPMVELRKNKGLNAPMAESQLEDNVVLGTMMLALDEVDGLVSGAVHTTANTIRPAFQLIKTRPDTQIVSSIFFMLLPDQVLVYGDCAVNPDPTAEELADIAIQSAESAAAFGIPPRVAMISYSTGTSGSGVDVEKVRKATELARSKRPELLIDGPLQYDAAAIESVARSKAPNSPVAGRATVFIFPDLNTGNTTYKAVQRSADVISVGPMLQGLRKPVNDLSRGALVDDIVYTIALTAVQAEQSHH